MLNSEYLKYLSSSFKRAGEELWQERRLGCLLLLYFVIIGIPFWCTVRPTELGMLGYDTAGHLTVPDMMISLRNVLEWNLRHPLYRLLYLPAILLGECIKLAFGVDPTWPLFLLTTDVLMSLSGLFIFKTFRALRLPATAAYAMLALYCSFAHVIMLSIQVDSFVTSLFFGSAMMLLFTTGRHSTLTDNLLFLGITGTTSTNCFKVAFYELLETRSPRPFLMRFLKTIVAFSILFALTLPSLAMRLVDRPRGLAYAVFGDSFAFHGTDISKWRLFFDNFLSDPILFHHTTGIIYSHETTFLPPYPSVLCYLPIVVIYATALVSIVVNRRHRLIHLFGCCFGFDVFMHFGIGYGVEEAQLFCGHWLFFLPAVCGLLLVQLRRTAYTVLLLTLGACAALCCGYNLTNYFMAL